MSLIDKLKRGSRSLGVLAALAVPISAVHSGCISVEQDDFRISMFGTAVKTEQFKPGTRIIESEMEMVVGPGGFNIKKYGENRTYQGEYRIRIENNFGNVRIYTERYAPDGKFIENIDGIPEDIPFEMQTKIR